MWLRGVGEVINNEIAICCGNHSQRVVHIHGIHTLWQRLLEGWLWGPGVPESAEHTGGQRRWNEVQET